MKVLGVLTTAIVFLALASRMPAYSQERDDAKQDQTQEEKDKAKNNDKDKARQQDNARRPDDKTARPDDKAGRHDEHSQPEATRPQEQRQDQRTEQRQDQRTEQRPEQGQAQRADQDRGGQRAEGQRSEGQRGRHIDDDKFRVSFGRQHVFHVDRTRIINSPQPVVVYGGYQFQLVDAWPADWGYDDDVYVDYIDGEYFLFNARHPGIRIAVFVLD